MCKLFQVYLSSDFYEIVCASSSVPFGKMYCLIIRIVKLVNNKLEPNNEEK